MENLDQIQPINHYITQRKESKESEKLQRTTELKSLGTIQIKIKSTKY